MNHQTKNRLPDTDLTHHRTIGSSMLPTIPENADVLIKNSPMPKLALGDLALFDHPELKKPILHRVILKSNTFPQAMILTAGDAHPLKTEWIPTSCFHGKAVMIVFPDAHTQNGITLKLNNFKKLIFTHGRTWVLQWISLLCIEILSALQKFRLYRSFFRRRFEKWIRIHQIESTNAVTFTALLFKQFAGKAVLSFSREHSQIHNFEIRARYRGFGIGDHLLREILFFAHKHHLKDVSLSVWEKHVPAIRLYEKMGFQSDGFYWQSSTRWLRPRRMITMKINLKEKS